MSTIEQFNTLDVAPDQRARYWNDLAQQHYAGSQVDAAYSDFNGEVSSWNLGRLRLLRPRTNACRVTRTPILDGEPRLIMHLQCRGVSDHEQGGRRVRLNPGDAVLCRTDRSYRIDLSRHETLVVEFPRHLLAGEIDGLNQWLVSKLPGTSPSLRILHDFLLSLWQQGYRETHHEGWEDEVSSVFSQLLAMALRGAAFDHNRRSEPALLQRVRALVEARLQDPQFSGSAIALDCQISVRAVQMIFAAMGTTPSAYIQERRLVRAAEKLVTHPEATITQIAFDHGFNDSAYFTRCFRRRNGVTPREFRIRN
ncbi:helix-turn-helix domain-containing protein [Alteraurantiacibacter aestuarii]|uniref:Helix-turn-helix domain-containing protein n=1 Tax=Alteraurantiacibacter aestuarii TaxID=650004 RepID=A0A844ZP15_9SPHN|nr:helix-turn-helix domain-containing protein [Alteraurantiacibacter aestuarii]MXO88786.1 helix-turn-helix domain-containing protein [Alteraurantiacibacter aestuarii]